MLWFSPSFCGHFPYAAVFFLTNSIASFPICVCCFALPLSLFCLLLHCLVGFFVLFCFVSFCLVLFCCVCSIRRRVLLIWLIYANWLAFDTHSLHLVCQRFSLAAHPPTPLQRPNDAIGSNLWVNSDVGNKAAVGGGEDGFP